MTHVLNRTARPFVIPAMNPDKGPRAMIKVFINPGMNDIPKADWDCVAKNPYVERLVKEGSVKAGEPTEFDTQEPDTETMVFAKSLPAPKKDVATGGGVSQQELQAAVMQTMGNVFASMLGQDFDPSMFAAKVSEEDEDLPEDEEQTPEDEDLPEDEEQTPEDEDPEGDGL